MTSERQIGYRRRRAFIEHLEEEHSVNTIKVFVGRSPYDKPFSRRHRALLFKLVTISNDEFRSPQIKIVNMRLSFE